MNPVSPDIRIPRFEVPQVPLPRVNPAEWAYERMAKQIAEFEKTLSDEDEIGLRLVGTPGAGVMHIADMGYWGPDMLIYYGQGEDGRPMQLLQHYTQMSILLTAVAKIADEPRRIGFHLTQKIETDSAG
jgi:hypothetical protein